MWMRKKPRDWMRLKLSVPVRGHSFVSILGKLNTWSSGYFRLTKLGNPMANWQRRNFHLPAVQVWSLSMLNMSGIAKMNRIRSKAESIPRTPQIDDFSSISGEEFSYGSLGLTLLHATLSQRSIKELASLTTGHLPVHNYDTMYTRKEETK